MKALWLILIGSLCWPALGVEIGATESAIARKRALLALNLAPRAVYTCLVQADDCGLNESEHNLLSEVLRLMTDQNTRAAVEFKSATQNPSLFDVGSGSHRLAVTGRTADSPILLNSDLIDPMGAGLRLESLVSIFVHEFGHHTGLADTEDHFLDQLGNKVARVFAQNLQSTRGQDSAHSSIEFWVYNQISGPDKIGNWSQENLGTWPQIFVSDSERILSLGASYPMLLNCPYGTSIRHAWLNDLHWKTGGRLSGKDLHYCLVGDTKMPVTEAYLADLELNPGPDGRMRLGDEPAQQMIRIPLFELVSDLSYENLLGMRGSTSMVEAVTGTASPAALETGGNWRVVFEVKGDRRIYSECSLLISSDEFTLTYPTGQIQAFESNSADCKMIHSGSGRFRIEALYRFPADSERRDYHLKAIKLLPRDLVNGNAGVVLPPNRISVMAGHRSAPPSDLTEMSLTSDGATVRSPALGFVENGLCNKFEFSFDLPPNTEVLQAHLKYTMHYRRDEFSPITLTDRITLNPLHSWRVRFDAAPGGRNRSIFTLWFMPEFMELDKIERIDFRELTVMTRNFEEHRITFQPGQFGLKTYFRPGIPCDSP